MKLESELLVILQVDGGNGRLYKSGFGEISKLREDGWWKCDVELFSYSYIYSL